MVAKGRKLHLEKLSLEYFLPKFHMSNLLMTKLIKPTDGIVSRYVNRKISTRITKFIVNHNIKVTPNQVSIISFVMGIISAILYTLGNPIIAGIGVQISSIVDGVDGELARFLGKSSRAGGFMDAMLDRFVDITTVSFVGLYLLLFRSINASILVPILMFALSGDLMVSYLHARAEASLGVHPLIAGRGVGFASRDVRLFLIFIGSLLEVVLNGILLYTLLAIGILSYTYTIFKTIEMTLVGERERKNNL